LKRWLHGHRRRSEIGFRAGIGPQGQSGFSRMRDRPGPATLWVVSYLISRPTSLEFSDALTRTREALAEQGFGVLCEIDVQATLKAKLGEEIEPYTILGACNPPLAHRALQEEPGLGVLLPCNVVVRVEDGSTRVEAVDSEALFALVGEPGLESIVTDVRRRLVDVVETVAA
jgi:uncharacterized protein (DUF302 family)